jgi:hypothetical protein
MAVCCNDIPGNRTAKQRETLNDLQVLIAHFLRILLVPVLRPGSSAMSVLMAYRSATQERYQTSRDHIERLTAAEDARLKVTSPPFHAKSCAAS